MFLIIGGGAIITSFLHLFHGGWVETLIEQFEHSSWNGFTFWDLIFPLFLFIVGTSMPFAISRRLQRGDNRKLLYRHIFQRFITLLVLGFIYNGLLDFDLAGMRWAGVLQRIAICYLIVALIMMNSKIRTQAIIFGGILLAYWAMMKLIPVPGHGAGILTPEANLSAWFDRQFLPGQFCCFSYGDNEGLLSTLPAISTTLAGALSGHWLRTDAPQGKKAVMLVLAGVVSIVIALIWNLAFPINKLIWTSSYVMLTAGLSLLFLALFYWIIDFRGYQKWAFPFVVIGLNPITIYVAASLFNFGIIANIFLHGFIDCTGIFKPLIMSISVVLVEWLLLYFLYRQKIFLKA